MGFAEQLIQHSFGVYRPAVFLFSKLIVGAGSTQRRKNVVLNKIPLYLSALNW